MIYRLVLFSIVFFAFAGLKIQWNDEDRKEIRLEREVDRKLVASCVESGLKVEHRFLIQLCRRRPAWFDTCGPIRKQINTLTKDHISERYRVMVDLIGDEYDPEIHTVGSFESALDYFTVVPPIKVTFLDEVLAQRLDSPRSYISARVISRCVGAYSDTFRRITYALTLGFVDLDGSDTGWLDFELE